MSQYYYTVASLPALLFHTQPALTTAQFLEICSISLKKVDLDLLRRLDLGQPQKAALKPGSGPVVLTRWQTWEINLRNALARLRAKNRSFVAEPFLQQAAEDYSAVLAAQAAFEEPSPLRAEELLDQARWQFLEQQTGGHYFDLSSLIIYALKLQILERRFALQPEAGRVKYNAIMQTFKQTIQSREQTYGI